MVNSKCLFALFSGHRNWWNIRPAGRHAGPVPHPVRGCWDFVAGHGLEAEAGQPGVLHAAGGHRSAQFEASDLETIKVVRRDFIFEIFQ